MALYKEIVYLVLDEIKSLNGDSTITEEHVIFLANHYRLFLLDLKVQKTGIQSLSSGNKQTICLDLEKINTIKDLLYCNDTYLRSKQLIPELFNDNIKVYTSDLFNSKITYVSKNRFLFVGYNTFMKNIIYCTKGDDDKLYFKSNNPLHLYLKKVRLTGIFQNSLKALELSCEDNTNCDIMNMEFPLEPDLIPSMIELIVKELYGAQWRLADSYNNSSDDVANLVAYLQKNTKSSLAKLLTE